MMGCGYIMNENSILKIETLISETEKRIMDRKNTVESMNPLDSSVSKEHPLVISFIGRFKTGKSSLINAILGYEILPTRANTATAVVTRIIKGSTTKAWLFENGKKKKLTINEAKEFILNYKTKDIDNCPEILIELPIAWLSRNVEIRDTPGTDDSAQEGILEEVTMHSLRDTDICVCVYDAAQMLSSKERERTKKIQKMFEGNVVYAVNRINLLSSPNDMELVRKQAESFFYRHSSAISQMGKFYMISSAPNNICFNDFDIWFKKIAGTSNLSLINQIRKVSFNGKLHMLSEDLVSENQADYTEIAKQISNIQGLHNNIMRSEKERISKINKNRADDFIINIAPQAFSCLSGMTPLKDTLSSRYQKAKDAGDDIDYSKLSSDVVKKHLKNNYKAVCLKWPEYFSKKDNGFIGNTIGKLNFPDRNIISVAASKGEKYIGAGAGAAIGLIFGPIGAVIGGAMGGLIGGAGSTKDNSVSNTMTFVKDTVIPALRNSFDNMTQEISKRVENETGVITTKYEPLLNNLLLEEKNLAMEKKHLLELKNI